MLQRAGNPKTTKVPLKGKPVQLLKVIYIRTQHDPKGSDCLYTGQGISDLLKRMYRLISQSRASLEECISGLYGAKVNVRS